MFGGFNGDTWLNDCWAFDLSSRTWTQVKCDNDAGPCERASAVAFPLHGDKMLVHGGYSGQAFLSDLWVLHTKWQGQAGQHHWQRIKRQHSSTAAFLHLDDTVSSAPLLQDNTTIPSPAAAGAQLALPSAAGEGSQVQPPAAAGAAPVAAPQGGAGSPTGQSGDMLDVWGEDAQLEAATADSRTQIQAALRRVHPSAGGTHNEWPTARSGHNGVQLGPLIIIFGGRFSGGRYNDVHVLNTDFMSWTRIVCTGDLPPTRKTHASARIGTDLYMCGGHSGELWLDDMYQLDLRSVLRQVAPALTIPRPLPSLQSDLARLLLAGNSATGALRGMVAPLAGLGALQTAMPSAAVAAAQPALLDSAASSVLLGITSTLRSQFVPPSGVEGTASRRSMAVAAAVAAHRSVDLLILQRYNLECSPSALTLPAGQHAPWVPQSMVSSSTSVSSSATAGGGSSSGGSGSMGVAPGGEAALRPLKARRLQHTGEGAVSGEPPLQLVQPSTQPDGADVQGAVDCSDLCVCVQGHCFNVHSVILRARSELFRGMLSGKWSLPQHDSQSAKHVVTLEDVTADHFARAVFWMYTDSVPAVGITKADTVELLQTADRLGCPQLSQLAQRHLEASMTVHNAADLLQSADELNAELLRQACLAFLVRTFEVSSLTVGYQRMRTALRDEVLLFRRRVMAGDSEHCAAAAASAVRRAEERRMALGLHATQEQHGMAVQAVSPPRVGGVKRQHDE